MSENFEVEMKFRVDDFSRIQQMLEDRNALPFSNKEQRDAYYQHPARDFAATDEALRIRRDGDDVCITWKGPKLDAETKTRREIELPLTVQHEHQWDQLLRNLGFTAAGEVRKQRREYELHLDGTCVHIALDQVERIGCFVELETIADEKSLDRGRQQLKLLATQLGLNDSIRTSYLQLVLDAS